MNIKDITQSFYSGDYQGYPPVTITGLKPGDEARDTSNNIVYEYSGVKWMPKVVVTGFDFRLGAGSSIQEMINSSDSYIPPIIQVYPGNSLEVPEGIRSSNSDLVIKHSLGSLNLRLSGIYFDAVNSVWRESNPGDEEIFITADGDYICWLGFLDKFKYSKVNISATAKVSQNITENVIISSVQPALSLVTGLVVDSTKLLGEVAIVGGTNTSVTHSGNTITIDSIGGGVGNVISVNGGTGEVIISVNGQTSTNINLDAEDVNAVSLDGRKEVTITATSGTVTISEYGCIYKATPTATSGTAMTFAFTNPTGDLNAEFDLILIMPATGSVSFPENLTWKYGTPTLSASTEYRLHFEYIDGSWQGFNRPEMSEYAKTSDTIPRIPAQSVGWVVKDDGNRQLILYGTPGFRTLELGHRWLGWLKLYGEGVNITLRSQKFSVKNGEEGVTYAEISSGGILSYSDVIATVNGGTIAMSKLATIQTAACTGMGIVQGTTTNTLTWIDPDDVVLNGALLTRYEQTDLVVADGHEPTSVTDGTIIATTNREAGTKNQYQFSGFVHTPTGITTPYYKLFTKASSGLYNNLTANLYPSTTSYSWGQIQSIVKAGTAASFFPVGTVFQIDHSEYTHINGDGIYFRVVGYDQVPAADSSLTHTMCLEMTECLFSAQFDQQKLQYALTADTVAITSKVYYTRSGTTYTALVEGRDWNPGDPVPMASWYERGNDSYNYWPRSNMRQWANSSDLAGSWYEPQSIWDQVNPLYNAKNGFMRSLDPAFKAVLVKSRLTVAKLNIEGGGYTTCDDFFFPLSNTQLFSPTPGENIQVEYYVNGGDKRKTIMDQAVYVPWWTRSANTGSSNFVYYVATSGSSASIHATFSYGVSLACIIA